jgi:uncharacterized phiE125 gp8 family phage protein
MPLVLEAPAVEPVTIDEVRAHARIEINEDDAWLDAAIRSARELVEVRTRRTLITTKLQERLDAFPDGGGEVKLRLPPLQQVDEIRYRDSAGVVQTMDAADYQVAIATRPGRVRPTTRWPTTQRVLEAIEIDYTAGYGDEPQHVPSVYRHVMLMITADWYERRLAFSGDGPRLDPAAERAIDNMLWSAGVQVEYA